MKKGSKHSEETKQKLRNFYKKNPHVLKPYQFKKGHTRSIGKNNPAYGRNQSGENNPMFGRKDHAQKMNYKRWKINRSSGIRKIIYRFIYLVKTKFGLWR